jgi:hypothetical protein
VVQPTGKCHAGIAARHPQNAVSSGSTGSTIATLIDHATPLSNAGSGNRRGSHRRAVGALRRRRRQMRANASSIQVILSAFGRTTLVSCVGVPWVGHDYHGTVFPDRRVTGKLGVHLPGPDWDQKTGLPVSRFGFPVSGSPGRRGQGPDACQLALETWEHFGRGTTCPDFKGHMPACYGPGLGALSGRGAACARGARGGGVGSCRERHANAPPPPTHLLLRWRRPVCRSTGPVRARGANRGERKQ